jgi:hypothetical protein
MTEYRFQKIQADFVKSLCHFLTVTEKAQRRRNCLILNLKGIVVAGGTRDMHSMRTLSRFSPSVTWACMVGLDRHVIMSLLPLQGAYDGIRFPDSVITAHSSVLAHEEAFLLALSC